MENISLFCGISSLGMPFPKENKEHIGYYDIILSRLQSDGYNVSGFNMSKLNKNHTWDLEKALNENATLASIKSIQLQSIDSLRNTNILFKLVVPKKFKNKIIINSSDHENTLKNIYINSDNPIFLYQGGPNDFFTYIQAGPVELTDRKVREKLPKDIKSLIEQCISNVEKNWQLLHQLNPNTKVYAMSYYYSPLYDKIQKLIFLQEKLKNKNKKYVNKFMEVINFYNRMLEEASKKYDYVEYCDITFLKDYCAPMDFHPNTTGNQLIADMLLKKIKLQTQKGNQTTNNNQSLRTK